MDVNKNQKLESSEKYFQIMNKAMKNKIAEQKNQKVKKCNKKSFKKVLTKEKKKSIIKNVHRRTKKYIEK